MTPEGAVEEEAVMTVAKLTLERHYGNGEGKLIVHMLEVVLLDYE